MEYLRREGVDLLKVNIKKMFKIEARLHQYEVIFHPFLIAITYKYSLNQAEFRKYCPVEK